MQGRLFGYNVQRIRQGPQRCSNAEQAREGRAGRVGRIITKTNLGTMVDDRTSLEFSRLHLHAGSG